MMITENICFIINETSIEVFSTELINRPPPAYSLTSPCLPPNSLREQDWPPVSSICFDGYPPYPAGLYYSFFFLLFVSSQEQNLRKKTCSEISSFTIIHEVISRNFVDSTTYNYNLFIDSLINSMFLFLNFFSFSIVITDLLV